MRASDKSPFNSASWHDAHYAHGFKLKAKRCGDSPIGADDAKHSGLLCCQSNNATIRLAFPHVNNNR